MLGDYQVVKFEDMWSEMVNELQKQSFKNYFDDAKEFQRSFKMNFKDEESKMSSKAKISR